MELKAAVEEFAVLYQPPVNEAIFELNGYLRNPTSGVSGRSFQIVLSLLAALVLLTALLGRRGTRLLVDEGLLPA